MPVVDRIALDYRDDVEFLAPAWKGTFEATERRAAELLPSGAVRWGLDAEGAVFEAFAVPAQPATVLLASDGTIFERWVGMRDEQAIRDSLDRLVTDAR